MRLTRFFAAGLVIAFGVAFLVGQNEPAKAPKPGAGIKRAPVTYSNPSSGTQMYKDYCAACHGAEGKGDGPAAQFLKTPPADLQTLAQRNNGSFPAYKVTEVLLFGPGSPAHGSSEMPVWGPAFRSQDTNDKVTALRIRNLSAFLESLQKK